MALQDTTKRGKERHFVPFSLAICSQARGLALGGSLQVVEAETGPPDLILSSLSSSGLHPLPPAARRWYSTPEPSMEVPPNP